MRDNTASDGEWNVFQSPLKSETASHSRHNRAIASRAFGFVKRAVGGFAERGGVVNRGRRRDASGKRDAEVLAVGAVVHTRERG